MTDPVQNSSASHIAQPSWPEQVAPAVANLLVDCQWIDLFERQPVKAVREFQNRRLSALLTHVVRQSSWWRGHLGERVQAQVRFSDLPLMTRHDFRASIAEAGGALPLPTGHGAAVKNSTSGSSGVPVEFYVSALSGRMNASHYFYDDRRQGRAPEKLVAELLGRIPEHEGEHKVTKGNRLLNQGITLGRKVQQATIEDHARWLAKVKPDYFCTAPVMLEGLLDVYGLGQVEPPRIEQVMSMAETVTPDLRKRARTVLGASIRDRYSCEEVGPIAFQCPHSDEHYHIAVTNSYVEVLDEEGRPCPPGVIGRVFVTSLHNYASPVIRYELGDLAAWERSCPCGHQQPVLTRMLGRKRFLVRLPSGERKAVCVEAKSWLDIAPFRETRLVQVSEGVLHAELVLNRPTTKDEQDAVLSMLRYQISPDLSYEIKEVERIDWGPTYKRQDVVSLI